jgi:competence protein ComEA
MTSFKIFAAGILAFAAIVCSPVWLEAAEAMTKPAAETKTAPSKTKPVDINSAPIDELKTLPGIGDAHAQRIIDNRPYQTKDQLVSRKIIPEENYNRIKDRIIAMQGSKG